MPCDLRIDDNARQEFCILRNMHPVGARIGQFMNGPLYDSIEDEWGRVYRYVGVCPRVGRHYAIVLGKREFIYPPGIIYRMFG
ncbi:MAG: hypothetical protein JSR89_01990 [Proteobacteria bacterium]|nr:hypothetical protein [Pseudomonadota bacterium]